ncbi:MAG: threonylcarbamoyl-AMP synthase [Paludibacteraceae bacterium]|nr:threonylcarbamoyl-AMP synthase [Paludibacteraceae bacterium]
MKEYNDKDIEKAVATLRNGGIILYPTDTVWGIGCDATNFEAVARIYSLKRRADSKSMLVLTADKAMTEIYAEISETALQLLNGKPYKPLTVIYPNAKNLAENLVSADGSIGIRISNEPFSQTLCRELGRPIVSTSANLSGHPTAKTFSQIEEIIRQGVDYIVEYRRDDEREQQPSSIIKVNTDGTTTVIRL